jgi:7-cyano-7-deazaguanine synthase
MTDTTAKAVCLLSGGMDSTVAAVWASKRYEIYGLHVGYGQKAALRERRSAEEVARRLGAREFRITEIPFLQELGGSALTDARLAIPTGAISSGEIPITQVPFRNGILLSLAVAWAEAIDARAVVIGAVEEDSSGYPDCREQFLIALERAVEMGTKPDRDIRIVAPLVHKTKGDIVRLGAELGAPFDASWSCYAEGPKPCNECESCLLRAKGFREAGIVDPLA